MTFLLVLIRIFLAFQGWTCYLPSLSIEVAEVELFLCFSSFIFAWKLSLAIAAAYLFYSLGIISLFLNSYPGNSLLLRLQSTEYFIHPFAENYIVNSGIKEAHKTLTKRHHGTYNDLHQSILCTTASIQAFHLHMQPYALGSVFKQDTIISQTVFIFPVSATSIGFFLHGIRLCSTGEHWHWRGHLPFRSRSRKAAWIHGMYSESFFRAGDNFKQQREKKFYSTW